ncbi:hypothetical protein ES703_88195 [subsurface metagenome]
MLPQVEVRSVGDAFKLLPVATAKREPVFNIDTGLGIVGKLGGIVFAKAQVFFLKT